MPFDLPLPSPLTSIVRQQQFRFTPIPETGGIGRRRDEAGARQIEITLARAFLGQSEAMAQLQLGLEEIGLEPIHRFG